jgi:hypothetical protein
MRYKDLKYERDQVARVLAKEAANTVMREPFNKFRERDKAPIQIQMEKINEAQARRERRRGKRAGKESD